MKLAANVDQIVDLMLIPQSNAFNFSNATWRALGNSRPDLKTLLASGASSDEAEKRYGDLEENRGGIVLACLLNITTAMRQIQLPQRTPLDYIKQVIWDSDGDFAITQDRFFAWVDPKLIGQIEQAKLQTPRKFERLSVSTRARPGAISRSSLGKPTSNLRSMKTTGKRLTV